MVQKKTFTVNAFGQKNNSEENISFSVIDVETKFRKEIFRRFSV